MAMARISRGDHLEITGPFTCWSALDGLATHDRHGPRQANGRALNLEGLNHAISTVDCLGLSYAIPSTHQFTHSRVRHLHFGEVDLIGGDAPPGDLVGRNFNGAAPLAVDPTDCDTAHDLAVTRKLLIKISTKFQWNAE